MVKEGALIGDAFALADGEPVSLTEITRRLIPIEGLFAFAGLPEKEE